MLRYATLFALALFTNIISHTLAHDHHKLHSHFCEGAGYSLSCNTGFSLHIDKAWYGRIAHDKESCLTNSSAPHPPDLSEDCGTSILDSKDSWCKLSKDKAGCSIRVKNLVHGEEKVPCPEDVEKYLYLEYECAGGSSGAPAAVVAAGGLGTRLLSLMTVVMMMSWRSSLQ